MEIYPGILLDPRVRFGKPCLAGTRIDVAAVIGALASGQSYEEVQASWQITHEQLLTALSYAAHVAAHQPHAVQKAS
jgi:uncharacterized protein (DUF433 family)